MQGAGSTQTLADFPRLLRGEGPWLHAWTESWRAPRVGLSLAVIVLGTGAYGAAMGLWRSPLQALYVAMKFPLIILATSFGNALLNAMLAPLLGINLTLRQSILAVLLSFSIVAAILGALSPIAAFLVWSAPALGSSAARSSGTYSIILLAHVASIASAGIAGNVRLLQLLRELGGSASAARRVLLAWFADNLFLGSQLSWLLRPFIGSPDLPVEFLRRTAFQGNFYEAVARSALHLLGFN